MKVLLKIVDYTNFKDQNIKSIKNLIEYFKTMKLAIDISRDKKMIID